MIFDIMCLIAASSAAFAFWAVRLPLRLLVVALDAASFAVGAVDGRVAAVAVRVGDFFSYCYEDDDADDFYEWE